MDPKPGVRTSEFWLSLAKLAQSLVLLMALAPAVAQGTPALWQPLLLVVDLAASAGVVGVYSYGRMKVKMAAILKRGVV